MCIRDSIGEDFLLSEKPVDVAVPCLQLVNLILGFLQIILPFADSGLFFFEDVYKRQVVGGE